MEGLLVTVRTERGTFESWAPYLAPVNDMESYSAICTTRKFLGSNYWRLSAQGSGDGVGVVSDAEARASLQAWLGQLRDAYAECFCTNARAVTDVGRRATSVS